MAVYNGEKYIEGQIKSILSQLSSCDELIVVNDFSTDNTMTIIYKIIDERLKIFNNIENLGVIRTFETAISKAKGNYIFLSDQDDIWHADKIHLTILAFQ
jgi:glycosyltransferase involved in cell wall biosynthesis